MDTITLKLTLTIKYDLNGEHEDNLKRLMYDIPQRAAGDGAMSGEGPATVDEWSMTVEEVR